MNISGSGRIAAGEYNDKISVSGSGTVEGNVRCIAFSVSGYSSCAGNVECKEKVSVSGSMSVADNLYADEIDVSGSFTVGKDCVVNDTIEVSGTMKCGGDIKCTVFRNAGYVSVEKGIEAEEIYIAGIVDSNGLINAETVDIKLGNKGSNVGSIGGANIKVRHLNHLKTIERLPLFTKLVGSENNGLNVAESIEGDVIAIENVSAPTVVGRIVAIGAGCRIDTVQYSEQVEIDSKAKVGKCEKI